MTQSTCSANLLKIGINFSPPCVLACKGLHLYNLLMTRMQFLQHSYPPFLRYSLPWCPKGHIITQLTGHICTRGRLLYSSPHPLAIRPWQTLDSTLSVRDACATWSAFSGACSKCLVNGAWMLSAMAVVPALLVCGKGTLERPSVLPCFSEAQYSIW